MQAHLLQSIFYYESDICYNSGSGQEINFSKNRFIKVREWAVMKRFSKLFVIILGVLLILAVATAAVGAGPNDSLVGLWHLDDGEGATAADSAGGNDGTVYGATWVDEGKFGGALSFNGIDNYVQLPPSSQILAGDTFTINAWFKTSYNHPEYGGAEGRLVNIKRNTIGSTSMSAVALYLEQDKIGLLYYTGSEHVWLKYTVDEEDYYYDDEWHYVTVTHDDDTYRLYYDGEEVAWQEDAFGETGTDNAYLGCYNPGERFFQGCLDEVGIWDQALSAEEVAALANPLTEMKKFKVSYARIDFCDGENDADYAHIKGTLKLDMNNGDGVDISEDVTVTVGTETETITMYEKDRKGRYWYYKRPRGDDGIINSMSINWKNGSFMIKMDRADFSGMTDPDSVKTGIIIGDDYGQKYLDMREKKQWRY
jgi:hypothetical protein